MTKAPTFDLAAAHQYFSAECFNRAWDLMEKPDRTLEEDRLMVALNQASMYHWEQRPDCDAMRRSIGHWQASRIQALLGNADEARKQAEACMEFSVGLEPFYLGYAYEALARAESLAGNASAASKHAAMAREYAERVEELDEREQMLADLESIEPSSGTA